MQSRRAFTLIELTVTIAVLGIVFAIAAPRQSEAAARYRSELSVQRINADIRLAELDAWYASQSRELAFDVAADRYEVVGMKDSLGRPYVVDLTVSPYRVTLSSVDFGGTDRLVLDGRTQSIPSGTIVLGLGGRSVTATITSSGVDGDGGLIGALFSILD